MCVCILTHCMWACAKLSAYYIYIYIFNLPVKKSCFACSHFIFRYTHIYIYVYIYMSISIFAFCFVRSTVYAYIHIYIYIDIYIYIWLCLFLTCADFRKGMMFELCESYPRIIPRIMPPNHTPKKIEIR